MEGNEPRKNGAMTVAGPEAGDKRIGRSPVVGPEVVQRCGDRNDEQISMCDGGWKRFRNDRITKGPLPGAGLL